MRWMDRGRSGSWDRRRGSAKLILGAPPDPLPSKQAWAANQQLSGSNKSLWQPGTGDPTGPAIYLSVCKGRRRPTGSGSIAPNPNRRFSQYPMISRIMRVPTRSVVFNDPVILLSPTRPR